MAIIFAPFIIQKIADDIVVPIGEKICLAIDNVKGIPEYIQNKSRERDRQSEKEKRDVVINQIRERNERRRKVQ